MIGVYVNRLFGSIGFSVNGKYFGMAYSDSSIQNLMIAPVCSLYKGASVKLRTNIKNNLYAGHVVRVEKS